MEAQPMKFSIRELVLVTTIVALALGWWLDHRFTTNESRRLAAEANRVKEVEVMAKFDREVLNHLELMLDKSVPGWRKQVMDNWTPPDSWKTAPKQNQN
jgi:hypothetical protein